MGLPGPTRLLQRIVDVRDEEVAALLWSCVYFFCVLSAYYIIRPVRDEMGVAGGVDNLPWLFTGTLVGMILFNPPYAALVARLRRLRFVSLSYRFFMANILVFFLLLRVATEAQNIWIGRIFFIWTSVFNLFVVSIFWAFMADLFTSAQGKRLFGFIGVGGTLGGIVGAGLTVGLAELLGPANLLLVSIALLEVGVFAVRRLSVISGDSGIGSRRPIPSERSAAGCSRASPMRCDLRICWASAPTCCCSRSRRRSSISTRPTSWIDRSTTARCARRFLPGSICWSTS